MRTDLPPGLALLITVVTLLLAALVAGVAWALMGRGL